MSHKPRRIRELIQEYSLSHPGVGAATTRSLGRIAKHFGAMAPAAVMPSTVRSYHRRDVAAPTLRRELGSLIAVLNWSAKTRLIAATDVPHIDLPQAGEARALYMTKPERDHFLQSALAYPRWRGRVGLFVALGVHTGARKQAICQLTWDRVDLTNRTVDYKRPGEVETKKRRVAAPMNETLYNILTTTPPVDSSSLVVGEGSIRIAFESFADSIGMSWVTPHVMRHTCATLMLQAGIPIWDVAGILGDTPETITKVYGHHATKALRHAVDALV